jgi:hypothetical protein
MIGSDFTRAATGIVAIECAGTPPDKVGLVTAAGAAALAGTLNIQLAAGFEPAVGDTFQILTYGSHTGTFAVINGLDLPHNRSFRVTFGASGVTLQVVQN